MYLILIGDNDSSSEKDFTYGYKIYLHERGQFWPGVDTKRLGQTESIYLKTNTRIDGNFRLVERRVLNTPARPCQEDQNYSFTRCLLEFVARRVGCHLDLIGTHRRDIQHSHWSVYNRTFPCMEANYHYAIKNQRGASKIHPKGGILRSKAPMHELVLYGIRLLA